MWRCRFCREAPEAAGGFERALRGEDHADGAHLQTGGNSWGKEQKNTEILLMIHTGRSDQSPGVVTAVDETFSTGEREKNPMWWSAVLHGDLCSFREAFLLHTGAHGDYLSYHGLPVSSDLHLSVSNNNVPKQTVVTIHIVSDLFFEFVTFQKVQDALWESCTRSQRVSGLQVLGRCCVVFFLFCFFKGEGDLTFARTVFKGLIIIIFFFFFLFLRTAFPLQLLPVCPAIPPASSKR